MCPYTSIITYKINFIILYNTYVINKTKYYENEWELILVK